MTTITTTSRTVESSTLTGLLESSANRFGDRIALQSASADVSVSFAALHERAQRGAGTLRGRGLSRGDRVLLVVDGGVEWAPSLFSILAADLVAVPIPASTSPSLVALAARYLGVTACVAAADSAVRHTVTSAPHITPADLATGRAWTSASLVEPDDVAVLAFTSGSTARPRAVPLSHANLLANLRSILAARTAGPFETLLSVLPPSHLYELVAGQLAPIGIGGRIVYAGAPLPNRILTAIRERRVTRMLLVPALLEALAREITDDLIDHGVIDTGCKDLSVSDLATRLTGLLPPAQARVRAAVADRIGTSLESLVVGGASLRTEWVDILRALGIGLDVGYGLTEAGPLVSVGSAMTDPEGSVGRPLPGVEVRTSAADEILVRSASVTSGRSDEAGQAPAVDDAGWLHTGDRGHLDTDGFLFVTGRIKEAIVSSNGETVYPEEVEPWYESPLFAEYCVVPARGSDGNDVSTLVIVPADSPVNDALVTRTVATLRAAAPARCRVAAFRCLADPLPRTALGKIQRRALAQSLDSHALEGGGR